MRDQRGIVWVALLLIMIPFLLVGTLLTIEHPRMVHGSDVELGQAVAEATRAAAMRVDAASQANGTPRIDPDAAHETFRYILARQLGLNETTLAPMAGSMMQTLPSYVLLIYNGDDLYTSHYVAKFTAINGVVVDEDYDDPAYPDQNGSFEQDFAVDSSDITAGSGNVTVNLKSPGCIAVIQNEVQPVITGGVKPVRWAAARVVSNL